MSRTVLLIYRLVFFLYELGIPIIPQIINKIFIRLLFGCQIQLGAVIGKNVELGNGGLGIVVHRHAVLKDNVVIGPSVTIGGTTNKFGAAHIGENTFIGTGARILGPVNIGKNSYVGANAVVIHDLPDNCLAVGVPAKIIKRNIDILKYNGIKEK